MSTKSNLLSFLKEDKGTWVSGELLSRKMAISRSAVWKQIRRLREEGYTIDSSKKKGYLLRKSSDLLLATEIRDGLKTRLFGNGNITHIRETDSTNLQAKRLADNGAPEGTVVVAECQTGGRGRRGRSWYSPTGEGIYVSVVLRPDLPPSEAPRLTMLASVAVAETLLALTPLAVRIKWPNDIMVGGKKLAGILTQISTEMDTVDYVIVGMGLNVHTAGNDFPPDLRNLATSILRETGIPGSRVDLLKGYLERLESWYEVFKQSGFTPVLRRWKDLSDIIGRQAVIELLNRRHAGEVLDVDHDGALILRDHNGTIQRVFSGDMTLLNP